MQKGLTQAQLAKELYVSRTAVSKWESGKGYPSIDTLRQIAKLFSVSVDQLLSTDSLPVPSDNISKKSRLYNTFQGLLDIAAVLLLFLPLFANRSENFVAAATLFNASVQPYLKGIYLAMIILSLAMGVLTLSLRNCRKEGLLKMIFPLSLILSATMSIIFTLSTQPYAAIFGFFVLAVKTILMLKHR